MEGILQRLSSFSAARLRILKGEKTHEEIEQKKREEFLAEIKDLQGRIRALQSCFDLETDFDLIDTYALELSSLERRYSYLIKKAKREKIRAF